MSLTSGIRLGVYEVVGPLGAGGMGEVYLARDTKLGRRVALKVLPDMFVKDADRVARFEREAKMLAALNHPHIAALHGMDQADGRHFLVMELIEGETLAERLQRGALPVNDALIVARQIAEALEAAHEKGVVHRDLKPANVKINADDQVKVLDFGLAKAIESDSGAASVANSPTLSMMASQAGLILGTAAYMSPEQAKGLPADQRSDIFSFGTVLYEMLTGRQPFHGETAPDILASVLVREPDLGLLPPGLHPRLVDLVRRCLEKHPKRRWQAIGDVRAEIETVQTMPAAGEAVAASVPRRSLVRRLVPFALTAAAAAVVTAAIAISWRPPAKPGLVARFELLAPPDQRLSGLGRQAVAISPDGTEIAFSAGGRLFRRLLSDIEARAVSGIEETTGVNNPVYSPNGRFIAFWSADRTLRRIATLGGAPITLCEAENPIGMTWGTDGIVYGQSDGVWRVGSDGGKPERLVEAGEGEILHGPQVLPGATHLMFTAAQGLTAEQWDRASIFVQPIAGGARTRLLEGGSDARYLSSGHLVYAVGGTLFGARLDLDRMQLSGQVVPVLEGVRRAVAASSGSTQFSVSELGSAVYVAGPPGTSVGQQDIALVERSGAVRPLKLVPSTYDFPRMSRDGKHIAFATDNGREAAIWVYTVAGTTGMSRLTFNGGNRFPIWAPDGQRVTFQSDREGDRGLFWQPADGQGPAERLTKAEPGTAHIPDAWSPDGKYLVFTIKTGNRFALFQWSAADRQVKPFAGVVSGTLPTADFSPDGRWIAYAYSTSGDSAANVYVQPFPPTGAQYQLAAKPGENPHHPRWSPDGKELFYIPRVMGFEVVPVELLPKFGFGAPSPAPRLFPVSSPTTPRTWDIARDGRIVSVILVGQTSGSSTTADSFRIVLNWSEELKARLTASQ
jgi:eukaryotic-like serine/threonine-protein kinase